MVPTLNNSNRVPTGTRSVSSESTSVKDERTEEAFAAFRSLFREPEIKKIDALQIFLGQSCLEENAKDIVNLRSTCHSLRHLDSSGISVSKLAVKKKLQGLTDEERKDLLHGAAQEGHVEVIKELLQGLSAKERKAYLHMASNNGVTPLYIAAQNGHVAVIKELLEGLSDEDRLIYLHKLNNRGGTPLDIAAQNGHVEVVCVLKEYLAQESWGMRVFRYFCMH
jgi:hypothetical protein